MFVISRSLQKCLMQASVAQMHITATVLKNFGGNLKSKSLRSMSDPIAVLSDPSLSYKDIFFTLQKQAQNSLLLQVDAVPDADEDFLCGDLQEFLEEIDTVNYFGPAYGSIHRSSQSRYYLVEFASQKGVKQMSRQSETGNLQLRMAKISSTSKTLSQTHRENKQELPGNLLKVISQMQQCSDMSEQMRLFHQTFSASSENLRAKFFLGTLLADFFNWHMKTSFTALPFGTAMTGVSSPSSDVDISLAEVSRGDDHFSIRSLTEVSSTTAEKYKDLRRHGSVKLFTEACQHISNHLPGVSNISAIEAKVPILSLHFQPFGIDADISLDNRSAVQMAWCANMYSRMDDRVSPLLFTIRQWAHQHHLTSHGGTDYDGLTPFMLTCLAYFYLMRVRPPILPSMRKLIRAHKKADDITIGVFRTLLIDDIGAVRQSDNRSSVDELLLGFFEYFRKLDFERSGLSLVEGHSVVNRRGKLLDIVSPLQGMESNIGKSCSLPALRKFQRQIELTMRRLEDCRRKSSRRKDWGLLSIIDVKKQLW